MQGILKYLLTGLSVLWTVSLPAQNDAEKYIKEQQAAFNQYAKISQEQFNKYRDSVNAEFAKYLREKWEEFDLQQKERSFKPMPAPPVYDPTKPQETPNPVPLKPAPEEKPQPVPDKPAPQPVPQPAPKPAVHPVKTVFFGKEMGVQSFSVSAGRLSGVSENEVANYWLSLSKQQTNILIDDILRLKNELKLNDWGMYLLINQLFQTHFSGRSENEEVVFSIFMLNQLGYRARIGRSGNTLVPLVAISNNVTNVSCFMFGNGNNQIVYYALHTDRKKLSSIQTCGREYNTAEQVMNISITQPPLLSNKISTKKLILKNKEYVFNYKQSLPAFYATYPCVDFSLYTNAPLEESFLKSLRSNLLPALQNKSQEDAVNFLLHFVQNAFSYQTDQVQFGYEKWNFAEETLVYPYCDCDDRAIFFAQLIKNLLGMKVVLVHYPGYHLATAVHFDNPKLSGASVTHQHVKYLICDPTYINANIGMAMPQLNGIPVEIIQIDN
jgi:hypothetical protein